MTVGKVNSLFEDITAIVLAGGKEKRLSQLGLPMPKALAPLADTPLIRYITGNLLLHVSRVVVAGGEISNVLGQNVTGDPRIRISPDPSIGTGVALLEAAQSVSTKHILVCNADTINDIRLEDVLNIHFQRQEKVTVTIVLTRNPDVQNAGKFAVDATGVVIRSFEDGLPGLPPHPDAVWHGASTGLFIIPKKLLFEVASGLILSLERDIIPRFIRLKKLYAYDNGPRFSLDIGVKERYLFFIREQEKLIQILKSGYVRP